jgi:branched-chain amino acid transport system substrate-binding protein
VFTRSPGTMGKLVTLIVLAVMALTTLSACGTSSTTAQGQKPIIVGASVPLTGDFSSDGKYLKQGYDLWTATVNKHGGLLGRKVEMDIVNDNSDPKQVATDYQKLITIDHVDLLFAPFTAVLATEGAKIASRYGYAYMAGSGGVETLFALNLHNLFLVSLPLKQYLNSFTDFLLSLSQRPKTVAYVLSDTPLAQQTIAIAKDKLEKGGLQTALFDTYQEETTDFNPIAQKIIQAKPDVVILGSELTACVAIIRAFKQQHFLPKALISVSGPDQGTDFSNPIGGSKAAEGIFVPNDSWAYNSKNYQNDQFTKDYIAQYGGRIQDISSDTVQGYAIGQVTEQAVNKIHSIDNAKLIEELHKDTFNSLQGPVKFSARGENIVEVPYLFQWQNGSLAVVYPASQAQAKPEYPKPDWPS